MRERPLPAWGVDFVPYRAAPDGVPPLAPLGGPHIVRFTGSSHDERGYLSKDVAAVGALNNRLVAKIEQHADEIAWLDADLQPGAETLIVSYGVSAHATRAAARRARAAGRRVSVLTVYSLWPVPEAAIRAALAGVRQVIVAELNHGQYRREIERLARGDQGVIGVHRVDGTFITPEEILAAGGLA